MALTPIFELKENITYKGTSSFWKKNMKYKGVHQAMVCVICGLIIIVSILLVFLGKVRIQMEKTLSFYNLLRKK